MPKRIRDEIWLFEYAMLSDFAKYVIENYPEIVSEFRKKKEDDEP